MTVKYLKHGIRLAKLSICGNTGVNYIMAKPWTIRGWFILRAKGYTRHKTIFGVCMKKEIKRMFKMFGEVEISKYRMGEYFDYAPYKTKKLPKRIVKLMYSLNLDKLIGENYIIKAVKTNNKQNVSFLKTLLKP